MRKKIAMRWRRKAIHKGAVIHYEGPARTKAQLLRLGLPQSKRGFYIRMEYGGEVYRLHANSMLDAYKLAVWVIDNTSEWNEYAVAICFLDGRSVLQE